MQIYVKIFCAIIKISIIIAQTEFFTIPIRDRRAVCLDPDRDRQDRPEEALWVRFRL